MKTLMLSFALIAASFAVSVNVASSETLGQKVAEGSMTQAAFSQLIAGTDFTAAEAGGMTLQEIVEIRWQDD